MNERVCANKVVQVSKPKKSVGLWRGLSWGLWSHFGLGGLGGLVGLVGLGGEGGLVGSDWVWK